ncbi:MAG: GatB/YqeY domain-containing protein [Patescibacteria group bacterium]|jgi:hypothetical protein
MATLTDQINTKLTEAMKSQNAFELNTLRMLKSALMNASLVGTNHQLDAAAEIAVVQTEVKKRKQSIEMYHQGNRPELAEKEQKEIDFLMQFLPAQMSEDEVKAIVAKAIASTGAVGKQDMSKVMGAVMPQLKGKADGGMVSAIVNQLLS